MHLFMIAAQKYYYSKSLRLTKASLIILLASISFISCTVRKSSAKYADTTKQMTSKSVTDHESNKQLLKQEAKENKGSKVVVLEARRKKTSASIDSALTSSKKSFRSEDKKILAQREQIKNQEISRKEKLTEETRNELLEELRNSKL
jgi:hypothetical protein